MIKSALWEESKNRKHASDSMGNKMQCNRNSLTYATEFNIDKVNVQTRIFLHFSLLLFRVCAVLELSIFPTN
jgi:hypothetical protein